MLDSRVQKNRFGYFEVIDKPSQEHLKRYYSEKFYQLSTSKSYQQIYTDAETQYTKNKLEQKYIAATPYLTTPAGNQEKYFLDVGAGEGWALSHFKKKGWQCIGLDYSEFGCRTQNPDCLKNLVVGDIYESLERLADEGRKFDLVLLDNVLEHVLEPFDLLTRIRELITPGGGLIIDVPNDFSVIQKILLANGHISRQFWVSIPEHLSYFNREGLLALCDATGWEAKRMLGDFPIDFLLFNQATNYVENESVGKSCHQMRIELENIMHSQSPEKTNALYEALADLGFGRSLIGFFQPKY